MNSKLDEDALFWPGDPVSNMFSFNFIIIWSPDRKENYKRLGKYYYVCGHKILQKALSEEENFGFKEEIVIAGLYLVRHSIELYLKSNLKENTEHDLDSLFSQIESTYLTDEEKKWLENYFSSLHEYDERSDYFRYPFIINEREINKSECGINTEENNEDESSYFRILNFEKTIENIETAHQLVRKCVGEKIDSTEFSLDNTDFLVLHKTICSKYPLVIEKEREIDIKRYSKFISAYRRAFFCLINEDSITNNEKALPMFFVLRHTIELSLKKLLFYKYETTSNKNNKKKCENILEKHDLIGIYNKSSDIFDDCKGNNTNADRIVKKIADEIMGKLAIFYKDENVFRYPYDNTDKNKLYTLSDKFDDFTSIIYDSLRIIDFFDGCDAVQSHKKEMRTEILKNCY